MDMFPYCIELHLQLCNHSYRLERVDEKTRLNIHQKVVARETPSGSARQGTSSKELQNRWKMRMNNIDFRLPLP